MLVGACALFLMTDGQNINIKPFWFIAKPDRAMAGNVEWLNGLKEML